MGNYRPKVKRFEADFGVYTTASHALAVNSCTAGLHTALTALGIGRGDEVIVPTLTFCATANVVVHLGATPVLADVGPDFQIDPIAIEKSITRDTRAIMPVHYAGQACDLTRFMSLPHNTNSQSSKTRHTRWALLTHGKEIVPIVLHPVILSCGERRRSHSTPTRT